MALEQDLEHVQERLDERRLEQGLHIRLEPGFVRVLLEVNRRRLLRLLLRVLEQGQGKGEGFPEWPPGRIAENGNDQYPVNAQGPNLGNY